MLGYTHNKATSSVLNLMLLHLRRHALTGQDVCCNSRNNKELIGAAAEAAAASLFRWSLLAFLVTGYLGLTKV